MFRTGILGTEPQKCCAPVLDGYSSRKFRGALKRDDLQNAELVEIFHDEVLKTERRRRVKNKSL